MNIKLLLRNKGYIVLLVIIPFVSVLMLNLNNEVSFASDEENYKIYELDNEGSRIINMKNTRLSVKVYDCSGSELSDYILQELANTGSYQIYRLKSDAMDIGEAREKALDFANRNVLGAIIYLPASFEEEILRGNGSNAVVFEATEDERIQLLKSNLTSFLQSLSDYAALAGYNREELVSLLAASAQKEMVKDTVIIEVGDHLSLTKYQQNSSSSIGYSLAFLTIAFLFSGVFIAATVVEERNNRVYNRIRLSVSSLISYGLVKLTLILATVLLQTGIIAIAIKVLVKTDYGISYSSYIFLVFWLGLIFNLFSVVIGVLTNNVLASNYIAFLVWCLSCVLAGLYFPLDSAPAWWSRLALLMPQRWAVKTGEMLMAGKSDAFLVYMLAVVSYLFIIASVGFMGIKIRKKD
jgi:ABC-2 type transport system permease protein